MTIKLIDLIDVEQIQPLLKAFSDVTGFVTAVLDLDGNILAQTGWRAICSNYHRVCPETAKKCTMSDTVLAGRLKKGEPYTMYKCLNGLVDIAVPIIIKEIHVGNLFAGQILMGPPDMAYFSQQADTCGFDRKKYLDALADVPVLPSAQVEKTVGFLRQLAEHLGEIGLKYYEQQETARIIHDSEQRYRALVSQIADGFALHEIICDASGVPIDYLFLEVNQAFENMLGMQAVDIIGKTVLDVLPQTEAQWIETYGQVALTGKPVKFTKYSSAIARTFEVMAYSPQPGLFATIFSDISERAESDRALRSSEERFRTALENIPDVVVIYDRDLRIQYINPATQRITGRPVTDFIGKREEEIWPPEVYAVYLPTLVSALNTKQVQFIETEISLSEGRVSRLRIICVPLLNAAGDVYEILGITTDFTPQMLIEIERQKIELTLRQHQKMESIGTLAGGVAHEINNPINGIMNYAQLIADQSEPGSQCAEFAQEIIHETERVAGIVRNLLTFAREEKESHSPARILDIIQSVLSLIRTIFQNDQITINVDIPENLPKIRCRSQQIQQVLMNLMNNARDALNAKYAGYDVDKVVTLSSELVEEKGRKWMHLTVEDHGTGIRSDVQKSMFDPFFTTKPNKIATGLGLAICYGIIRDHSGEITVDSALGQYTKIGFKLPLDQE